MLSRKVDVDLSPDFVRDVARHGEEQMKQIMLRE
jgi:hypothetical protein